MQADFGVHGEREIDGRGSLRELNDVARRREDENLVLVQVELEELEKLVWSLRVHLQLEHLPEPLEVPVEIVRARLDFLVAPVRRDAIVRGAVHLARADLDLEQLAAGPEYGRVQRLVSVGLR